MRAAEIAQHVGREYRLNDGSQLVDVEAGPLTVNDVPLTPVVRTERRGGDIIPIYGDGILYVLNGLGKDGAVSSEAASFKRGALVRREALELALYTFRYVKDVDHVVAMLPPGKSAAEVEAATPASATPSAAASASADPATEPAPLTAGKPVLTMLFRPGDVRAQLEAPLALTFPTATPRPATLTDREEQLLNQFSAQHVFSASVVPNQTGQGFLVLDRTAAPTTADELLQSTIPKGSK